MAKKSLVQPASESAELPNDDDQRQFHQNILYFIPQYIFLVHLINLTGEKK
jgi:hypothetical protein